MEEPWFSFVVLAGRSLLALVYLVSGIHKGMWYRKALTEFQQARIPFVEIAVVGTVVLHVVAPICLFLGIFVFEAALALAAFTALATFKAHDFWNLSGTDRLDQSRIFLAHSAIIGGLLLLAAIGPGRYVVMGW